MRETVLLNDGWHFHEGDIVNDSESDGIQCYVPKTERMQHGPAALFYNGHSLNYYKAGRPESKDWSIVMIPHDYVINQAPDKHEMAYLGYFKYQSAWYRKYISFPKEDEGKRITLEFDGIASRATVYFNGCILAHNMCGYTSFEVDITDFVNYGETNLLALYVDSDANYREGWYYEGAGIYRPVRLVKTDSVSVDRYGVYVRNEKLSDSLWRVNIETTICSIMKENSPVLLKSELVDANDVVIASAQCECEAEGLSKTVAKYQFDVENPLLWDVDSPNLYTVKTYVIKNGEIIDIYTAKTGFRTFRCDAERGFFLNGRHLKIQGVCMHEDCGLFGRATPDNVHRYKLEMIKDMGANGYRTSHYMQHSAILDAADELGLIVVDETRWFSSSKESLEQLEELVKRDRNRPSVFFWSIGNEEPYITKDCGRRIARTMKGTVDKLDGTRPVTFACNSPAEEVGFGELDIVGINYYWHTIDDKHKQYPDKPLLSTENCATATSRGWYNDNNTQLQYYSAYDHTSHPIHYKSREITWKFIMERDFMMGGYQWDAFEHRGETIWPRLCSQSGAIDMFLQRKDAFYQNLSHWGKKPMIHMLPHWNIDVFDDEPVKVWAYTNCEEAELFVNGKSLGRQKVTRYTPVEWMAPYEKGEAKVVGYIGGEAVALDVNETAGKPTELVLKLENRPESALDAAIITCYTVDSEGRRVPDAEPFVEFFANEKGRIISTGSDDCDHTPVHSMQRKMHAGTITVAAGVAISSEGAYIGAHETIEVYAKAEGLKSTRLKVEF